MSATPSITVLEQDVSPARRILLASIIALTGAALALITALVPYYHLSIAPSGFTNAQGQFVAVNGVTNSPGITLQDLTHTSEQVVATGRFYNPIPPLETVFGLAAPLSWLLAAAMLIVAAGLLRTPFAAALAGVAVLVAYRHYGEVKTLTASTAAAQHTPAMGATTLVLSFLSVLGAAVWMFVICAQHRSALRARLRTQFEAGEIDEMPPTLYERAVTAGFSPFAKAVVTAAEKAKAAADKDEETSPSRSRFTP